MILEPAGMKERINEALPKEMKVFGKKPFFRPKENFDQIS